MSDYDLWIKDMIIGSIILHSCPQCGKELKRVENLYFPDRDTYNCDFCNLGFTQIAPGEIIITYKIIWDDSKNNFVQIK